VFEVEEDPRFERDGDDLYTDIALTYAQAALGATVKVPTLEGDVELKIDAGTQPGTVKVLRGKGVQNVHGRGKGDLGVRLTVAVPRKVSGEHKKRSSRWPPSKAKRRRASPTTASSASAGAKKRSAASSDRGRSLVS